jgi:hypothetical protein
MQRGGKPATRGRLQQPNRVVLSAFLTKGAGGGVAAGTKQLPTQQFLIAYAIIMAARNIHGFFFVSYNENKCIVRDTLRSWLCQG